MKIKNTDIQIIQGDITEIAVDAIVNPANDELVMYTGLAHVLKNKGGDIVQDEAHQESPIKVGESVETTAGGLKAKYIIHAAVNKIDKQPEEKSIRSACRSALTLANELGLKTIAIPTLGCGVGGFPAVGSAKIISQEILKHCQYEETSLVEIIICLFDEATFLTFEQTISGYITHIQDTLGNGPYVTVDIIIEVVVPADEIVDDEEDDGIEEEPVGKEGIIIIERSNPPYGHALPGGFLDYGESLEEAAIREAKEETNMDLKDLMQFHTYSALDRDPRFQTVSTVFTAKGIGSPCSGDDAKSLKIVPLDELKAMEFAFDHKEIILEYLKLRALGR